MLTSSLGLENSAAVACACAYARARERKVRACARALTEHTVHTVHSGLKCTHNTSCKKGSSRGKKILERVAYVGFLQDFEIFRAFSVGNRWVKSAGKFNTL